MYLKKSLSLHCSRKNPTFSLLFEKKKLSFHCSKFMIFYSKRNDNISMWLSFKWTINEGLCNLCRWNLVSSTESFVSSAISSINIILLDHLLHGLGICKIYFMITWRFISLNGWIHTWIHPINFILHKEMWVDCGSILLIKVSSIFIWLLA